MRAVAIVCALCVSVAVGFPMSAELIKERLSHMNGPPADQQQASQDLTPAMQATLNQQVESIKSQLLPTLGGGLAGCQYSSGASFFDLSSLGGSDIPGTDPQYGYKMSVCGTVTEAGCAGKAGSVCQYNQAGGYIHMLCSWTAAPAMQWGLVNSADPTKGVTATFANGDLCYNSGQTNPRGVTITFPCQTGAVGPTTFTIATSPTNPCSYLVAVSASSAACPSSTPPPPPPGPNNGVVTVSVGISGGTTFLIILMVVVPIYIGAGCLFKRQRMGTQGMESCPNWDFWRSLPGLVKDGCTFTWGKLRALGGGSGGGASSYETVK